MAIEEISIDEAAADWSAFDEIIDVRAPGEFAEDHIPRAVNLPVLSDAERAEVGRIYVRESPFKARKIGAALVARNVARHLETSLADRPGGYAPLVHCWRGGQRSRGMAIILDQIGWRVRTLRGGYKAFRTRVVQRLYEAEPWFRLVMIDGPTGVGKTALLARLAERGAAVLDLEDLAAHRGSIFGAAPGREQPSQKWFETRILQELEQGCGHRAVFVEAESAKIGARQAPPTLWKAMCAAPAIAVEAPLGARARHIRASYAGIAEDPRRLDAMLERLAPLVGREQTDGWRRLAAEGDLLRLIEELMRRHYDPRYARSSISARRRLGAIRLGDVSDGEIDRAAEAALRLARGL